jgi:transcription elongation GreA/GreB family factor
MLEEQGIQPQREQSTPTDEHEPDFGEEDSESTVGSSMKSDRAEVGDTVVYVTDESPDSERQVMITRDNSNPDWGTINFKTPIAQAILGARVGDVVEAKLPMGIKILRIRQIKKG